MTKNILNAVKDGNRIEALKALAERLAETLDDPTTPPRDAAALSRQLTLVLAEIDEGHVPEDSSELEGLLDE